MTRLYLPPIVARRCLISARSLGPNGALVPGVWCSRATGHTRRHVATVGPRRLVVAVWSS